MFCGARGAVAGWALAVSILGLGCGSRSALGLFDFPPEEPHLDAGFVPPPDGGMDARVDAGLDASVDAGDGDAAMDAGLLPFEGPLDVIGLRTLANGELRVITLRNATDGAGPLEIHGLDETTGQFMKLCEGGDATGARVLNLPRDPGDMPTASDERLLVEHSDCGRPPTCPPRELYLMDLDCGAVGAPIDGAVSWFPIGESIYVLQQTGELLKVNAQTGEIDLLATDAASLRYDGHDALWSTQGGQVIRRDLDGNITGEAGTGVRSLWLRAGEDEVAFDDDEGVKIWDGTSPAPTLLEAGACRPVYAYDALMFLSPCDTGSLVVEDRRRGGRYAIADDVTTVPFAQWNDQNKEITYVVDPGAMVGPEGPIARRPWPDLWLFRPPDSRVHLASQVLLVRGLGTGGIGLIHDAMGDVGTFSVWTADGGVQPVADRVIEVESSAKVHGLLTNYDGTQGDVLLVDRIDMSTEVVASHVPKRGYKVGNTAPELVYVHDVDPALGTGTLATYTLATGETRTIDTRVTSGFIRVSSPAPGGVIYAVYDGTRSDVRFAFFESPTP